jgi:ATP-binding region ATPase domain protein
MKNEFRFNISLQILNHLGRNLYRNFITVLGEAISNSWDADATNVWVQIDREKNIMSILDDGVGMSKDDFQNKFLKIGYSKRNTGQYKTTLKGRPFIGRKGIGKLALLSCAKNITILSQAKGGDLVGGMINNDELEQAIQDDVSSTDYSLGAPSDETLNSSAEQLNEQGTLIIFDHLNDGIHNRMEYISKLVALHFRFALIDKDFSIYINGNLVTVDCLSDLANATEFIWETQGFSDPFLDSCTSVKERATLSAPESLPFKGFIASVQKPKDLKIRGLSEERISIDLFVNGRLRERNFFRSISSARIATNYLYGQIHIDTLDDGGRIDRFTSSREGVIGDDPYVRKYLEHFENTLRLIENQWDSLRREHKEDGDPDNKSTTRQRRKAEELINILTKDYRSIPEQKVEAWLNELREDAYFSLEAYGDCFIAENLLRAYIEDSHKDTASAPLSFHEKAEERRKQEIRTLKGLHHTTDIRLKTTDPYYVDLRDLFAEIDPKTKGNGSIILGLLRNVVAHTGQLSEKAKEDLTNEVSKVKLRIISELSKS